MSTDTRSRGRKISEMVNDEALQAEAETGDGDETTPDGDETATGESAAPDADAEPSSEASATAFDDECLRHLEAVVEILGDNRAAYDICERCEGRGVRPSDGLLFDPGLVECDSCGGEGLFKTHSKRQGKETRECTRCQGEGFVIRVNVPPMPAPAGDPLTPRFDPYTGAPLAPGHVTPGYQAVGTWAPGYEPGASGLPAPVPFG